MKIKQFSNLFLRKVPLNQASFKSFSTNLGIIRGDLNKPKEALPQENRDSVEKSNAKGKSANTNSSSSSSTTNTSGKGATENSQRASTTMGYSVSEQESNSGAFPDALKEEYNKMMKINKEEEQRAASLASSQKDDLHTKHSEHRTINDVRNEQQAEHNKQTP
ncbi:predicted protein [Naegleria gruberi]|uniref:Predicted protein n=1 Tax=Naegleria gruberi TaxID=5762 RepID=D2W336_NAEGR|nr:uncharacterized protein NAEGRDRAFT_75807 [Naegleria gruberi]EFC36544.1 predicted protein [Naegleria gruberi]|eukprot:XP_002669288.1 predicted protein [Naegleria gruberi strain NEG-M]